MGEVRRMKARTNRALLALLVSSCAFQPLIAQAPAGAQSSAMPEPAARPHVIVWMLDDVGFAQLSCFGGLIQTPNIDRVARRGVRFTNYRTAPICSASRAALLTGRNPHSVHMGGHAGAPLPYPGYDGVVPASAGTIAANLKAAGYQTVALGKWDHLPSADMTQAGPFTLWPTGQGFDKFYGFLGADADNWQPVLIDGTTPIKTPATAQYHLNNDLADQAIAAFAARDARRAAPPVFIYFATGTAHAPHHAPPEWIARYRGKFDMGWDKARAAVLDQQIAMGIMPTGTSLAPRPEGMPAWSSLSAEDKQLYARQMEVFAAAVSHADEQFGRVLDALEARGELDNTIIAITSDNGASAEGAFHGTHNETLFMNGHYPSADENMAFLDRWGGPDTQPHYAFGWAVAGNTPFRYFKQTTHDGGIRVPLIMSWPKALAAQGEVRGDFAYVADVTPTILDLAGVPRAATLNNVAQSPMEGLSLKARLLSSSAPIPSRAQYFEMYGNKGLWQDGWMIVTSHRLDPWRMDQLNPITEPWELYNTQADQGQTNDLASRYPDRVRQLAELFEAQARQYNVNPISNFGDSRAFAGQAFMAEMSARKGLWAFDRPISNIGFGAAPPVALRPFQMTAQLDLRSSADTGPIFAFGGASGGMATYLSKGVAGFAFRDLHGNLQVVEAPAALPAGPVNLTVRIDRPSPQPMRVETVSVTISAGEKVLVSQNVTTTIPATYGVAETFDIGMDRGSAVSPAYRPDQSFSGKLGKVSFQFR